MKKSIFLILVLIVIIYVASTKFLLGAGVLGVYAISFLIALARKKTFEELLETSIKYSQKSKIVIFVFIFVGALTSSWIASGTIPGIIYYGIKFINPKIFILFSFFISSLVAFFLGSSFGSASTIGVSLMAIARSGNIDLDIVGASIICGIYFGDRWSPLSSSANLVASLTEVDIYSNLKNMIKSMIVPYLLTAVFYFFLSKNYILNTSESNLTNLILENYNLDIRFIFIPVISIIIFSIFRINIKISMGVSIFIASVVAIFVQQEKFIDIVNYLIMGFYKFDGTTLEKIIKGGGVASMLNATSLVFISCALVGIFEELNILKFVKQKIIDVKTRAELFRNTVIVSIVAGMVGANQTIAVVMTEQIIENIYDEKKIKRIDLAKDIENSAIVLPSITPWNIACYIPCTMFGITGVKFIPYATYIWLIPLCTYIYYRFFLKEKNI